MKKLSIGVAMALFGLIVAAGFAGLYFTDQTALSQVRIGSPAYQRIVEAKDLVADVMPPPAYIVEPYLEASLALAEPEKATQHEARLRALRGNYQASVDHWRKSDIGQRLKRLVERSDNEAQIFWTLADDKFIPALQRSDMQAARAAYREMSNAYEAHLAIINQVVARAQENQRRHEAEAVASDRHFKSVSDVVSGTVLIVVLLGIAAVMLFIVRPITTITGVMRKLAGGDLEMAVPYERRPDEIGAMAKAVTVFKQTAIEERRRTQAERAQAEETARVVSTIGDGLASLARGELSTRIRSEMNGEFAQLKQNFNTAVTKLEDAIRVVLDSSDTIGTGAREISHASDNLSRRTEQQAASLEESAAALEQITSAVKQTATNAQSAGTLASTARKAAQDGAAVVNTAVDAMGQIESSSRQITDIIGVIDEIAFQTNLLALNAGVEAARAGDAGRGFAVVASEVRALSQRSSEAAKEIKRLIQASGSHVEAGVKHVGEASGALKTIVDQVKAIDALVSEMAAAAQQQSTGIGEVNTAVGQMDQITQQNAAMVEESTAAARNLASETERLLDLIRFFSVGRSDGHGRANRMREAA